MNKGIIYYTHNGLRTKGRDMLFSVVQEQIKRSGLPIVSCSLEPMDFGKNVVLDATRGPVTMFRQILLALETSEAEYVFFCEHDVLYHPSHFEFTPERDDTFYYNTNVWRWDYFGDKVITHDRMISLSGLCVNKEIAVDVYRKRLETIYKNGYDKLPTFGNPLWARKMGYEPGKLPNSLELLGEWRSLYPNIDVRHRRNMTVEKMTLESFTRKPTGWEESTIDKLHGWNIKELFKK